MPPTTPTNGSNPASLNYLVIYNPTLQPDPNSPKQPDVDEDDEIEQAHILFYTARDRAVSRDVMLRQVGLAKALNNFSEMFALHGCNSVHSQKRRTIVFSPETNFWMVASVDVPKNPRQPITSTAAASKDKSKRQPNKGTEKGKPSEPGRTSETFEYRENVLFDDVLRTYLRRGYEEFKLLHGSFQQYISISSRTALEKLLEQFFTPWAWKWDVDVISDQSTSSSSDALDDNGPDFVSYLGVPLHPTTPSLSKTSNSVLPVLERIYSTAPSTTSPVLLCLQPPSLFLPPTLHNTPVIPPSLPRYLLSTIQLPPELRRRHRRASVASTATLRSPPRIHKQSASIAGSTAASFIPRIGQGLETVAGVANPKKWGWPGFLTFGRSEGSSVAPSRDVSPSRAAKDSAPSPPASNENAEKEDSAQDGTLTVRQTSATGTERPSRHDSRESFGLSDTKSEAEEQENRHSEATPDIDESLLADAIKEVADTMRIVASSESEDTDPQESASQRGRLVFALVHDLETRPGNEQSEWQTELAGSVCKLLEDLDHAIEKENLRSEDKLVGRAQSVDTTRHERGSNTRHIIYDPQAEIASSSSSYNSRSPHYSSAKQLFAGYSTVSEVFARANSLSWFAAKRKANEFEDDVNEPQKVYAKEVYAEVSRKDVSLVDVDQEIDLLMS
ncbi:hypothetical protein FRB90_000130 [Tulasnella sp. 427]|nr:hypothetical protein FRB90_000130 [Tulasnella sp. 427]